MSNQIQLRERASYSYCARSWRLQTNPSRKNFPSSWKCYKTIGSYVSCAFIEIWSTWGVWRALKKLELLSAMPRAALTRLSCSPNLQTKPRMPLLVRSYIIVVKSNVFETSFLFSILSTYLGRVGRENIWLKMLWWRNAMKLYHIRRFGPIGQ